MLESSSTLLPSCLDRIEGYISALAPLQEVIIANAIIAGEIPAPTFSERKRATFLCDRFVESGLESVHQDEVGNALGMLPGLLGERDIIVFAHIDTPFKQTVDHTVRVLPDTMTGPGIGDNALGIAAVASLPAIFEHLNIRLKHNLILMGDVRSLGRGDIEGMRSFMHSNKRPLSAGICVEGMPLGRLSFSTIGMFRAEITCNVSADYHWRSGGGPGAIGFLADFIHEIQALPEVKESGVSLILGSVRGGTTYNTTATQARVGFEVRAHEQASVLAVESAIEQLMDRMSQSVGCSFTMGILARRAQGGISDEHPLVQMSLAVMRALNIEPSVMPTTGSASALIDCGVPAVVLGLTRGKHFHEENECIKIEPVYRGLAQLIGVLQAIDDYGTF